MKTWICIAASVMAAGVGATGPASAQTVQADKLAQEMAAQAKAMQSLAARDMTVAGVDVQLAIERSLEALQKSGMDLDFTVRSKTEAALDALGKAQWSAGSAFAGATTVEALDQAVREAAAAARESVRQTKFYTTGSKEQSLYAQATSAADESRWDRALELYTQIIAMKGERVDAALYWKAYVQNKLGQRPEALATIQQLLKDYSKSRWISDAKALEVEVRGATGQPVRPEAESDDELKLLALNGLMNSDADQALGIVQKLLQGPQSRKIKQRALFVLSQNKSAKARDILVSIAKGSSNPDLQRDALNYIGMSRSAENSALLASIYAAAAESVLKEQILRSLMMAGARDQLLTVAKSEADAKLRLEAIRQLAMLRATEPLWQMYQSEINADVRREIVRSMMMSSDIDHLTQIAKTETDPKVRLEAVRVLGLTGKDKSASTLVELYAAPNQTIEVRREVINALFLQSNAKALVDIARKETNQELRKSLVQRLSLMKSKEATDFLMEIINK